MVFQRRACEAQALPGIEPAQGLGRLGTGILDYLGLIANRDVERDFL